MTPFYVKNLLETLSLVKNAKVNPLWPEVTTWLAKLSGIHVEEKIPNENLLLVVAEKIPDDEERIAFVVGVKTFWATAFSASFFSVVVSFPSWVKMLATAASAVKA